MFSDLDCILVLLFLRTSVGNFGREFIRIVVVCAIVQLRMLVHRCIVNSRICIGCSTLLQISIFVPIAWLLAGHHLQAVR